MSILASELVAVSCSRQDGALSSLSSSNGGGSAAPCLYLVFLAGTRYYGGKMSPSGYAERL